MKAIKELAQIITIQNEPDRSDFLALWVRRWVSQVNQISEVPFGIIASDADKKRLLIESLQKVSHRVATKYTSKQWIRTPEGKNTLELSTLLINPEPKGGEIGKVLQMPTV